MKKIRLLSFFLITGCTLVITSPACARNIMERLGRRGLAYGPWFLALFTPPWTGYAIHDTNEPYLAGAPVSHGCIRLDMENIERLRKAGKAGTPIKIVH